jgi:hypothetical protein
MKKTGNTFAPWVLALTFALVLWGCVQVEEENPWFEASGDPGTLTVTQAPLTETARRPFPACLHGSLPRAPLRKH